MALTPINQVRQADWDECDSFSATITLGDGEGYAAGKARHGSFDAALAAINSVIGSQIPIRKVSVVQITGFKGKKVVAVQEWHGPAWVKKNPVSYTSPVPNYQPTAGYRLGHVRTADMIPFVQFRTKKAAGLAAAAIGWSKADCFAVLVSNFGWERWVIVAPVTGEWVTRFGYYQALKDRGIGSPTEEML